MQKGKVSLAANRRECSIQQLMVGLAPTASLSQLKRQLISAWNSLLRPGVQVVPAERKLLVVSHGIVTILSMDDVTQTNKVPRP